MISLTLYTTYNEKYLVETTNKQPDFFVRETSDKRSLDVFLVFIPS